MPLIPPKPLGRPKRVDAVRSFRAGQAARAAGRAVTAVPYDVNSGDPAEILRVHAWVRGWRTPIV